MSASFSSPTPASGSRTVATTALRTAGLIDSDARMKDVSDKPGGRKATNKSRLHRPKPLDSLRAHPTGRGQNSTLAPRITSSSSEPLSIRGASRASALERIRRGAASPAPGSSKRAASPPRPILHVKVLEVWRSCVRSRWNPETRFLNLERLLEDEILIKNNVLPAGGVSISAREMSVVFKIASRFTPSVKIVSLAHNKFGNGQIMSTLAHYLPDIENLSLQNNNLRVWRDIDYALGKKDKFNCLRELILIGNPVREIEIQNGRGDKYKREIARRIPSLELLDQEAITTITFDAPQASTSTISGPRRPPATEFPADMRPSFITGVDDAVVPNFLTRYLSLFDSQRHALVDVYHSASTFSYCVNTAIPTRAKIQGFHTSMPNQRKLQWSSWIGGSRNLGRLGGGANKQVTTLHVGSEDIVNTLMALPGTRHEVMGKAEKFCLDAWPVGTGENTNLFITVHGEFVEAPSEGIRSFDRSFVVAPSPEGSRARMNGWDVVILSDQLTVRAYSSHEAWTPGPLQVDATKPPQMHLQTGVIPPQVQQQLNEIPEPQRTLVMQLCHRTNLNVKFALDCLHNNAWDMDRAIANFEQVKPSLGPEAYL